MKTFRLSLLTILALVLAHGLQAQAPAAAPATEGAVIEFEKNLHDFGELPQHGDASTEFKFTNTGTAPLKITNAKGTCGCTVPQWPREEIAPGESGVIHVRYDSKRIGGINKAVMVFSNATNSPTTTLKIKGNIKPPAQPQAQPPVKGVPVGDPQSK